MQTNCPHARVQYLISVKTGFPYFKKFPCRKANICDDCAMAIGAEYEARPLHAINQGKKVKYVILTNDELESFRRKYHGKHHYFNVPTGENINHVWHDVETFKGEVVTIFDLSNFDWAQLARDKADYALTTPNQRANVSGKLGYKAPEPDGKEAFQDVAVHVEDSIKEEAMPIIRQASAQAFHEKGRAQSVQEAEVLTQRFGDLVDDLMQKAGLAEYTISRVWSRDVFPVSSKAAKDNVKNDSEDNTLDDDTLEIIERFREKQALVD